MVAMEATMIKDQCIIIITYVGHCHVMLTYASSIHACNGYCDIPFALLFPMDVVSIKEQSVVYAFSSQPDPFESVLF
jgi:hypothetical protein